MVGRTRVPTQRLRAIRDNRSYEVSLTCHVSDMRGVGSDHGPAEPVVARPLDAADRRIIAGLVADGRSSIRTLAERLHISRANAYSRVERLLSEGIIRGFSARIAPERAGLGTSAYVSLTIEQQAWPQVRDRLSEVRYIEHMALVGAEVDVILLVRAPDNATLRRVVLEHVQAVPGVKETRTWLIFGEVDGRGPDWAAPL